MIIKVRANIPRSYAKAVSCITFNNLPDEKIDIDELEAIAESFVDRFNAEFIESMQDPDIKKHMIYLMILETDLKKLADEQELAERTKEIYGEKFEAQENNNSMDLQKALDALRALTSVGELIKSLKEKN